MKKITFKKYLKAMLLGSITMFVWGAFSHLVVIIGIGYKPLPNAENITKTLQNSISQKGLYFFPSKDFKNTSSEAEKQWLTKFENGPVGLLVYRPVGGNPFSLKKLFIQFLSYLFVTILSILILSSVYASFWKKVLIISLIGIVGCTSVSVIYWNWYEFPNSFILAQFADISIGFVFLGIVLAKFSPSSNSVVKL
ncbi:hypothetical protein [Aequorivita sp. Q41]|uniref:hypothetical protein n=1 Tax=Aequorivita sp. Q41 TaxID=3153300 RepID=UPI0032429049